MTRNLVGRIFIFTGGPWWPQGSYEVWLQITRDGVALKRRLSLAEPIPTMISVTTNRWLSSKLLFQSPMFPGIIWSVSWLLVPWLLASPDHEEPQHSQLIIGHWLPRGKSLGEWYGIQIHIYTPSQIFQHTKDWIIRILFPDFAMIFKSVTLIIPPTGITLLVPSGLNMLVALSMSTCHHNQLLNEQLDNEQVPGTPGPKWDARKYTLIFHQRNHNSHHLGHPRCRRMECFCEFKVQFKTLHVVQITRIM